MSHHVYLSPIAGDGGADNRYRPAVADAPGVRSWSAFLSCHRNGPRRGHPRLDWALIRAEVEDDAVDDLAARAVDLGAFDGGLASLDAAPDEHVLELARKQLGVSERRVDRAHTMAQLLEALVAAHERGANARLFAGLAAGLHPVRGGQGGGQFLFDTMTDADGTLLQDHDPDIGEEWEPLDFRAFTTTFGTVDAGMDDNRLRSLGVPGGPNSFSSRCYRNAVVPPGSAYTVEAHVRWGTGGTNDSMHTLLSRVSPTGTSDGGVDRYQFQGVANANIDIIRVVAGSQTTLATAFSVVPENEEGDLVFHVSDGQKIGTLLDEDGVALAEIETADNEITQVGRAGIAVARPQEDEALAWMDDVDTGAAGAEARIGAVRLGIGRHLITTFAPETNAPGWSNTGGDAKWPSAEQIVLVPFTMPWAGVIKGMWAIFEEGNFNYWMAVYEMRNVDGPGPVSVGGSFFFSAPDTVVSSTVTFNDFDDWRLYRKVFHGTREASEGVNIGSELSRILASTNEQPGGGTYYLALACNAADVTVVGQALSSRKAIFQSGMLLATMDLELPGMPEEITPAQLSDGRSSAAEFTAPQDEAVWPFMGVLVDRSSTWLD